MHMLKQCTVKAKQILTSTITEKGQTTIPADVRKALSLKPHQRLTYEICEGGVVVRPETENLMDLVGSLRSKVPAGSKARERDVARAARRGRHQ
jgi:antitoxin PrlF